MTIKINKKTIIIALSAIIIILGAWFGISKYIDYKHWQAPMYESKKEEILLSDKEDKMNNDQEQEFTNIAHSIISQEREETDFENDFDDKSLFVKKTNEKKTYYVEYVCRYEPMKMNFTTTFFVKLDHSSLKKDVTYRYWNYNSDLTDY